MAAELMIKWAVAYVYSGEWVSDCPREGCANVEFLYTAARPHGPRTIPKPFFACSYCGEQAEIKWPPTEFREAVMEVLMKRPVPGNRNWYPKDHETAVRFKIPHGQTVADLREENESHGVTP